MRTTNHEFPIPQAEIFDNGDFEYRYDLSRISDMDALTNVGLCTKMCVKK